MVGTPVEPMFTPMTFDHQAIFNARWGGSYSPLQRF